MEDSQFILMEYLYSKKEKIDRPAIEKELAHHFGYPKFIYAEISKLISKKLIDGSSFLPINNFNELYLAEKAERDILRQEKSATREILWYNTTEAKRRFDDYPKLEKRARIAILIAILALIVQVIVIVLKLIWPKLF